MEIVDMVSELVSNVGFPIAAFCALFWLCTKTIKESGDETRRIVDQNTAAIAELTKTVAMLIERLGADDVV